MLGNCKPTPYFCSSLLIMLWVFNGKTQGLPPSGLRFL